MNQKYDFVIIGSGLGGLECGLIMAKEGYSVCILEKNHQVGGNLQVFSRDKTIFDTGVHYIGGLDEGQNLNRFFKYFDLMDKLKLKKMDEERFDIITFEGDPKEYYHSQGYENFEKGLIKQFPEEEKAILTYTARLRDICSKFPLYNLEYKDAEYLNEEFLSVSAREYIDSITENETLRNVLAGTNALYAGYSNKTPLYVHALVCNTYIESSYRCVDGGSQIAIALTKQLNALGGKILKRREVIGFEYEGDKISAAVTDTGEKFYGENFISNIHPQATLNLVEEGRMRKAYYNRIRSLENSISCFIVHIACKPESFPYLNSNYYHSKISDVWGAVDYTNENWPLGYMLCTPASSKSDTYADGIAIMTYMRTEDCSPWLDSFNTIAKKNNRGQSYEEFKRECEERIIDEVEKRFPLIKGSISSVHSSTPLTFRDYIGNIDGSLYGVVKDYKSPLKTFITPKTKIPNLFLTGENINLHGILGVTVSAVVTCSEFLGRKYLLDKINNANVNEL